MANPSSILVIDDQIGVVESVDQRYFLRDIGAIDKSGIATPEFPYKVVFFQGGPHSDDYSIEFVLEQIRLGWKPDQNRVWAIVLLDVKFGRQSHFGLQVLSAIRQDPQLGEAVPVIMLTGEREQHQAALRKADGFMPKMLPNGSGTTREILDQKIFQSGLIPDHRTSRRLAGESLAFLQTLRRIRQAVHQGSIPQACLLGEPGVGKTELARYAHELSHASEAPFQHLTADPGNPQLQLGHLFGAWPRAHSEAGPIGYPGAFELAHGGTLLLDEVANLTPEVQKRLLEARAGTNGRTRIITRYGTPPLTNAKLLERCREHMRGELDSNTGRISVDVSLVTATNAPLNDARERSKLGFREDLWAGLLPAIGVPNLNQRRSDIPTLFLQLMHDHFAQQEINVDQDVYDVLSKVDWSPRGNIRGLNKIVSDPRMRYLDFGVVTVSQLPPDLLEVQKILRPGSHAKAAVPEATRDSAARVSHSGAGERAELGAILVRRYREDLELLLETLRLTQDASDSKPLPARALKRLLNKSFSGAEIARTIKKLFFKPVFEPSLSLDRCLREHGLAELQQWVLSTPLLREYAAEWKAVRPKAGKNADI